MYISDEALNFLGPLYLVSKQREVKHPTQGKCVTVWWSMSLIKTWCENILRREMRLAESNKEK